MKKNILKRAANALCAVLALTLAFACTGCDNGDNDSNKPAPVEKPEHLGLYEEDGVMMKDGKPYYGVGVNYYNLLNSAFAQKWDITPSLQALETLKTYDVRVIRFNVAGYKQEEWNYVTKLEDMYFEKFDAIVAKAEELEIGLIPSFFWSHGAVSDYFDEPSGTAYSQRDSKTTQFMLEFTEKVVKRYAESPAIYGWEYSNEVNLVSDLPNWTPSPLPASSKRESRTNDDKMTTTHYHNGLKFWAETVKANDPYGRIIGNGDAVQRESAWNLRQGNGWKTDTKEQYEKILDYLHEDMTAVSTHIYADCGPSGSGWRNAEKLSNANGLYDDWATYLQFLKAEGARMKKTVYLGETGFTYPKATQAVIDGGLSNAEKAKVCGVIADAALEADFPLTLFWNYDHRPEYNADDPTDHSTGTEWSWNERWEKGRLILEKIRETNKAFDAKHKN